MSLISTLTSSSSSMSSLTSTTSSSIQISQVLTFAIIASGVLIFLLFMNEVGRNSSGYKGGVLRAMYVPLIITFCACVFFSLAQAL